MNKKGLVYEQKAIDFLIKNGFKIIKRNARWKRTEVDIICEKDKEIYAIEVKYRKNIEFLSLSEEQKTRINNYMQVHFSGVFFKFKILFFSYNQETPLIYDN